LDAARVLLPTAPTPAGAGAVATAYEPDAYERLLHIKNAYDPRNLVERPG